MARYILAILGSLACIWSFESAVYTLPAIFFVEYINKSLKKFLPIFILCFSVILILYLAPFILEGKRPLFERFYEYAILYSNGFGQVALSRLTNFWWLFPLLYGFVLIKIISGDILNKIIIALTIYGMALFTYYGGRADPNNLFHISIPFILLSIYVILNLNSISHFAKQILLTLAITLFVSVNYQWGSETGHNVMKGIGKINLPLVLNQFLPTAKQINITRASESADQIVLTDCSMYSSLKKYIENGTIALLSEDDNLYQFYTCTKTHNALAVNPYDEVSFNPKAAERTLQKVVTMPNHFLLIDADLLKNKIDRLGSPMVAEILQNKSLKKVNRVRLAHSTFIVFRVS